MGKPKTTAAPAAIEPAPVPVAEPTPAEKPPAPDPVDPQPVEPLEDFLRRVEGAHLDRDVVATAATHPEATDRVWPGTYGGIRLSQGPASVTYSDGTQA